MNLTKDELEQAGAAFRIAAEAFSGKPHRTKTHAIACSGGCGKILGASELADDHPDPSSSTAGYICETCLPAYEKKHRADFEKAEAREIALRLVLEEFLADHPDKIEKARSKG
jgi:hypothetical protein